MNIWLTLRFLVGGKSVKMAQDIVRLNVGGVLFTTTKATLCRCPDSMLGAMFNGSMSTAKDEQGCFFIDRDGSMFGHVLNFLRSSQLALPSDFQYFDHLAVEADFYQIDPLLQALAKLKHQRSRKPSPCGRLLEVIEVRTGSTATMPTNNSRVKTIVSGRCDILRSLPPIFIGPVDKLKHINDGEFTEIGLNGSNVRLILAEYLLSKGWKVINSDLSSSSGYDSKSMISSLIIEQSYRDRWFLPETAAEECSINGVQKSMNLQVVRYN